MASPLFRNIVYPLLGFCAVAAVAAACWLQYAGGNAGDKDWLLYLGGQLIQGKKLDVDWIEVNPPLIVWLYTLPAYIAACYGLADFHVLAILGLLIALASCSICFLLLRRHPGLNERALSGIFAFLLFLLIVRTPPGYFFDRDHIFLTLTLPYLLRWLPVLSSQAFPSWLRTVTGLMAGVGFCIKPHCLILWAGVQALTVIRTKSVRMLVSVENGLIYLLGAAYLVSVGLFVPEYLRTVLPMALATYGAFNRRIDGLLYAAVAAFTLSVAFCEFRFRQRSLYRADVGYLAGLCFFALLYGLANNGWGYAYNPLICLCLLTAYWLALEFTALRNAASAGSADVKRFIFGRRAATLSISLHAGAALLMIGIALLASSQFDCARYPACLLNQSLQREIRAGDKTRSFAAISPVVGSWSHLSKETGAPWRSHFNHLWMLPKFFLSGAAFTEMHAGILHYVSLRLADTLSAQKPDVVFIDADVYSPAAHRLIDLKEYFSHDAAFKTAIGNYRYDKTLDYCGAIAPGGPHPMGCSFKVYSRISP